MEKQQIIERLDGLLRLIDHYQIMYAYWRRRDNPIYHEIFNEADALCVKLFKMDETL
jgi:hypothetical protein